MKILLDENLPHDLRHFLVGHDVFTVAFLQWAGTQNGALLQRAAKDGFDVMLTADAGIAEQHNPEALPLSVLIVHPKTTSMNDLVPLVPEILVVLGEIQSRSLVHVGL